MGVHVFRRSSYQNHWQEVTPGAAGGDPRVIDWHHGSPDLVSRLSVERRWAKFARRMPLCCVDTLVTRGDSMLLTLRDHVPQAARWWIQGGALRKGEGLEHAATRTAKRDTGLDVKLLGLLGVFSTMSDPAAPPKAATHSINVTFLGSVPDGSIAGANHTWWPLGEPTGNAYLDQLARLARRELERLAPM